MWDLKPFSIYALCSQEKSYVFFLFCEHHGVDLSQPV